MSLRLVACGFSRAQSKTPDLFPDRGFRYKRLRMIWPALRWPAFRYIDSCHPGTHPSGSLRLSKLAPGQFVTWRVVVTEVNYQKSEIKKPRQMAGFSYLALDDDLLSHGETPHYHRRCIVSLLSSGWDQVVPMLYCRQAIRYCPVRPNSLKA